VNIFKKIMVDEAKLERSLGNPLSTPEARERRLNVMALMTGGQGFRTPRQNEKRGVSAGEKRRRVRAAFRVAEGRANG
jgi:hypothetical protein